MSGNPNTDDPKSMADQAPDSAPDDSVDAAQQSPLEAGAFEARIAELDGQVSDLTDRLLRAHAEMDNIRKRAERDKTDMAKYAISKFAADVLAIGDNFARAAGAVPPDAAEQDPTLKALLEGVTMMEREFLNVLERNGVRRVDPTGEPFNPHLHQAVMEQHNAEVPSGTVVQVFQPGYTIEDRVLRPAMVVVAKGGPKTAEKPSAEAAQDLVGGEPEQRHALLADQRPGTAFGDQVVQGAHPHGRSGCHGRAGRCRAAHGASSRSVVVRAARALRRSGWPRSPGRAGRA